MPYLGNVPAEAYSQMSYQDLTGGSGTSFTLDYPVGNENEIEVFVNNVRQEPTVAYTTAGTALTMTGTIAATDDFYVVFQGKAQQTIGIPEKQTNGDYNFDSNTLYIDASVNSVGIGTASPSYPMTIVSASNSVGLAINGRSADGLGAAYWFANNGTTQHGDIRASASEFRISSTPASAVQTFYTNGSERLRILSSGGITFNGDTAAANALDDYEEGTWTPVINGTAGNPSITYTNQTGHYTKIGNIVRFHVNLQWSAASGGSGIIAITLPFATNASVSWQGAFVHGYNSGISVTAAAAGYTDPGRGDYFMRAVSDNTTTIATSQLNSTGHLIHSGVYMV